MGPALSVGRNRRLREECRISHLAPLGVSSFRIIEASVVRDVLAKRIIGIAVGLRIALRLNQIGFKEMYPVRPWRRFGPVSNCADDDTVSGIALMLIRIQLRPANANVELEHDILVERS